jgi:DNA-binding LytR/AlgR family response regulator
VVKYLNGNFYRCHKSCIINFEKILRMEDGVFYFSNGATLRVGQNNYRHTRNHYVKYLDQNAGINS